MRVVKKSIRTIKIENICKLLILVISSKFLSNLSKIKKKKMRTFTVFKLKFKMTKMMFILIKILIKGIKTIKIKFLAEFNSQQK